MRASPCVRWLVRFAAPFACALVTACGSGDGVQGVAVGGPLLPTFSSIQANVLTPLCEQCHAGATAPGGLRLDAANSYGLLVGVASRQQPSLRRVQPGDADASYLVHKLEGRAAVGERMPAGLPPLPQADIDVIRQWINDGALPDTPQSTSPVRVTSLTPAPGTVEPTLPMSVVAVFDRELNATTVDATTFLLTRSGGTGVFGDGDDVAVGAASVGVSTANAATVVMDLTGVASVDDTYRVALVAEGPVVILDLGGNALDGEYAGAFPSGNGIAGGNFVAEFEVGGLEATLSSIQAEVFTPRCSGCHNGATPTLPGSLDLTSAAVSHASLVGVASMQVPALQRVAPGAADDSYLIRKLESAPGIVGTPMPRVGPLLDQPTIDAIRLWITNGAAM